MDRATLHFDRGEPRHPGGQVFDRTEGWLMEEQSYEERAARGARPQSLFREVNERVMEINRAFSEDIPLADWICECASDVCAERIELSHKEYEEVRSVPTRFAVAPSDAHVVPEIEDVVVQHERYWIVEKRDRAGELATRVDPRRAEKPQTDGSSGLRLITSPPE